MAARREAPAIVFAMRWSVLSVRLGALLGLSASLLAMWIEAEAESARGMGVVYVSPLCDRYGFSCSKVLTSKYAKVLSLWGLVEAGGPADVSNALLGALFYVATLVLSAPAVLRLPPAFARQALLAAATGSLAFSAYLAFILKTVLRENCPICITMYASNVAIFVGVAAQTARAMQRAAGKRD